MNPTLAVVIAIFSLVGFAIYCNRKSRRKTVILYGEIVQELSNTGKSLHISVRTSAGQMLTLRFNTGDRFFCAHSGDECFHWRDRELHEKFFKSDWVLVEACEDVDEDAFVVTRLLEATKN